jgi:CTP synthase (UTP-ammonia lyase)
MDMDIRIALVGDFDERIRAHQAIPVALRLAGAQLARSVIADWVHTSKIGSDPSRELDGYAGIWCVPGSPYANATGAIAAIRFARTSERPFLGTCGGFQHALLEYAQAEWDIDLPAHAEADPNAADPVIVPLECPLIDVADRIDFALTSRLATIYGVASTTEEYLCRYGLSPAYATRLESGPLRIAARDARGAVIGVEHATHPFFIATLFQPERAALKNHTPPLVSAFVSAAGRA